MMPPAPYLLLLPLLWLAAGAQSPSPLVSARTNAAVTPGAWMQAEARAVSALQAGFPATAAAGFRELLADPNLPVGARSRVSLALVSALMDAGELGAAEQALQAYTGPRDSAYHLRAGLLALQAHGLAPAKAALAAGKPEDLAPADRGWWFYLQAQVAESENDPERRNRAYEEAARAATSELQRLRFLIGQQQAMLRVGHFSEAELTTLRSNLEKSAGQRISYDYVRTVAAALAALNRRDEALSLLQRQLAILPATERSAADQLRLCLALVAPEENPIGRRMLTEVLTQGLKPDTQRVALYLLARGAKTAEQRAQLRRDLDLLLGAPTLHPIVEHLLLVRAQAALADRQYVPADDDVRLLLERYPGSPLKAAALSVRLSVAWELKRYRAAADFSVQLRDLLPPGRERAELGVLLAEAYFLAGSFAPGDYLNAADAYDAALREVPLAAPAGVLIFQRVLADIRADRLEAAASLLDAKAGNADFAADYRWKAEWNLVKEMQVRGKNAAAQARVEKLLGGAPAVVPADLRVRLLWLLAKLSYDNGQDQAALTQVDELMARLPDSPLEPALRTDVASTALLLKAQALLALGRDQEGSALLERLRADYQAANAAVYSYIVQASWYTQKGETVRAQQLLIELTDRHPGSEFAPLALYEAALCEERRGLDDSLRNAYRLLEKHLILLYPQDELVFYARLKQGDLLRQLNDFGAARLIYEDLVNNYGQHPDVLLAQLALADSLFAQGGNSVVNFESAAALYERLRDRPTAPVDLRAEAGYKWGYALAQRNRSAQAQTVYWSVVDEFLLDASRAEKLGARGRYWVARALLELGQLHEEAGRLDEARQAYRLIVAHGLGGAAQAQARLERYRLPEATRP